ncbi:hypothetical protein [Bradyrhizobium sp.]|uniref:hypothetical protein n=1 Tax=Bradyrhizobium sp. TaxID=376 RepID=UPI0025BCB724|nr:hypothetical protein [Bradyrhizobium sp.]
MVDIVVTPANVVGGADAERIQGVAGATVLAGQVVYRDSVTRRFLLADNNSATPDVRNPIGIALHGASNGQPLAVQTGGDLNVGATLVVGETYYLSDTPGGICPEADLVTGEFVSVLGVATTASNLKMRMLVSGAAVP